MTKQEAIKTIQKMLEVNKNEHRTLMERQVTALGMAIEALKETDMGLNNGDHLHPFGEPFGWTEEEIQKHGLRELLKEVDNKNDDLFRRESVINEINDVANMRPYRVVGERETYSSYNEGWTDGLNQLEANINALPSAQPEIVRCKDCKHWGKRGLCEKWDYYINNEDFYCGCAERRTDG